MQLNHEILATFSLAYRYCLEEIGPTPYITD